MSFIDYLITFVVFVLLIGIFAFYLKSFYQKDKILALPSPNFDGGISVEKAIKSRRSVRSYKQDGLSMTHVSQLLWAAQGITGDDGFRSAPSAGATYPIEVYLIAGKVTDLTAGVYKYSNKNHALIKIDSGDKRADLSDAAFFQEWIKDAPIALVICGMYERTSKKYGESAQKYVHMEVGCVAQNVYLQAASLGLGTTFVGAVDEGKIATILSLDKGEHALCVLPIGVLN